MLLEIINRMEMMRTRKRCSSGRTMAFGHKMLCVGNLATLGKLLY